MGRKNRESATGRSNGTVLSGTMDPRRSLQAAYCIDADAASVTRKARELTVGCADARETARQIFYYVRDEIRYNFGPDVKHRRDFRASHTLELGNGFCMQKAALFAALCRASAIPARIGFQNVVDYKITGRFFEMMGTNELIHHGMNAVYLEGRWLRVDCTLDRKLTERKGYRLVEFDGHHEALLPATDLAGEPHFTITRQSGFYNDTPLFAIRSMLDWTREVPYDEWRALVHRRGASM